MVMKTLLQNSILFLVTSTLLLACNNGPLALRLGATDQAEPPAAQKPQGQTQDPTISFAQVSAFSLQSCAKCHNGDEQPGLFAYNDYRQNLEDILKTVVEKRSMPRRQKLTDEQVQMVKDWIDQGAPEFIPNQPLEPDPEPAPTTTTTMTLSTTTTTQPAPVTTTTTTLLGSAITFDQVLKTSFQSCTKCHSAGDEIPTLESYADYKENLALVNKTVVVKRSMPKKQKLTDAQVQLVKDWIDLGAPEN
jgi:mono/diheme cytochrome c family protein